MPNRHLIQIITVALLIVGMLGGAGPARGQGPAPEGGPAPAAACGAGVSFGVVCEGGLGATGEVDSYSFSGSANDVITVRIQRTAGAMTPTIGIYNAGGALAHIPACTIDASGTYTVFIQDYHLQGTGSYQLLMQRLGQPGQAQQLSLGAVATGSISNTIDIDVFSFNATINDQLILRARRESGAMTMYLRLYNAGGELICSNVGAALAVVEPCTIPATGAYHLFVADYRTDQTGTYTLHTQRLNNPGGAQSLQVGRAVSGGIDKPAALDSFTFSGQRDDVVGLALTRSSGSFTPYLRVYDSGGDLICSKVHSSAAAISQCTLTADGRYTVIADDYNRTNVGNYTLLLSCVSGSCQERLFLPLLRR